MYRFSFVTAFLCIFTSSAVWGSTIILDALDSGRYYRYGFHHADDKGYESGCGANNYFVFNISSLPTITSATLKLSTGGGDFRGGYTLHQVDTPIAELKAGHGYGGNPERIDITRDLRSGTPYHQGNWVDIHPDATGHDYVPLNADAISALNSASGEFAIGGSYAGGGYACAYAFKNTDASSTRQLILETQDNTSVTLASPNTGGTYKPGDTPILEWTTTEADPDDAMVLSMKRDSFSHLTEPDGVNWYRFTDNTPNDGREQVTLPEGLAEADDWRFFVRHAASDVFDASDQTVTLAPTDALLTVTVSSNNGGTIEAFFKEDGTFAHINCPSSSCGQIYPLGTVIELHATPSDGFVFAEWTGCEPDTPAYREVCTVVMDTPRTVSAGFVPAPVATHIDVDATSTSDPLNVVFTCVTAANGSDIAGFEWDFGDDAGFSGPSATVAHPYPGEGDYTASCQAVDQMANKSNTVTTQVSLPQDLDYDGLPDAWEVHGFRDVLAPGESTFDPDDLDNSKDLFLWIDYMVLNMSIDHDLIGKHQSFKPDESIINDVADAFRRRGITLHITVADQGVPYEDPFTSPLLWDDIVEHGLDDKYKTWGPHHKHVYRHALMASVINSLFGPGGAATAPRYSHQAIVVAYEAIKLKTRDAANAELRVALMHELGHALNLGHGGPCFDAPTGNDSNQCDSNDKPNYLSIMNYIYSKTRRGLAYSDGSGAITDGLLDYAFATYYDLDELDLNEYDGVRVKDVPPGIIGGPIAGSHDQYEVLFRTTSARLVDGNFVSPLAGLPTPIDWDGDGNYSETIQKDLNDDPELEKLEAMSDWDNLVFAGWDIGRVPGSNSRPAPLRASGVTTETADAYLGGNVCPLPTMRYYHPVDFRLTPYKEDATYYYSEAGRQVALGWNLTNVGLEADTYDIEIATDNGWPILPQSEVSLDPGHRRTLQTLVEVPDGVTEGDIEHVRIAARSRRNSRYVEAANFTIEIRGGLPLDSDGDNLPDDNEVTLGLDPFDPDSDNDGIYDGVEVIDLAEPEDRDGDSIIDALDPDDLSPEDTDGDGLGDEQEIQLGLDPFEPDTDDDGIIDGVEVGTPRVDDPPIDYDNDGLIDAREPEDEAYDEDVDDDGIIDGEDGCLDKTTNLPIIHHLLQFLIRNPRVLQRVSGVLMPKLALHGRDVPRLLDDMPPHGMAGGVRGLALHTGKCADLVPDVVDDNA